MHVVCRHKWAFNFNPTLFPTDSQWQSTWVCESVFASKNFCKTMLESNNAMPPQHHHHRHRGLAVSKDTKKDEAKSLW